jgi:hypothetical protein
MDNNNSKVEDTNANHQSKEQEKASKKKGGILKKGENPKKE